MISHFKDKIVSRQSYLYNGNNYTCKYGLYIETGSSVDAGSINLDPFQYKDRLSQVWEFSC